MVATTSKAYATKQAHSSSRQHSKNEKEQKRLNGTSVLETVLLVPTAVASYNDTNAHTRTLTNPHAEEPFAAVT